MRCLVAEKKTDIYFVTDCSKLVKMVFSAIEWPTFDIYLEKIMKSKGLFLTFSISHISRKSNVKPDLIARSDRVYMIMYVNDVFPN